MNKEHREQVIFFNVVKMKYRELYDRKLIFAVPNAAKRSKSLSSMMKAEGLQSGISDIICLFPSKCYHGLCMEMKIKPNKPTDNQKIFLESVSEQGYKTAVCYSAEEALNVLGDYLQGRE